MKLPKNLAGAPFHFQLDAHFDIGHIKVDPAVGGAELMFAKENDAMIPQRLFHSALEPFFGSDGIAIRF